MQKWVIETNADYHENSAIGASGIVDMLDSGAHFKCGGKGPGAKTAHESTMVHTALIEPKRFKRNMVQEPDAAWCTKKGKPVWLDFFQELQEKDLLTMTPDEAYSVKVDDRPSVYKSEVIHVSVDEMAMIKGIKERVFDSDVFRDLLIGIPEMSGYLETDDEFDKITIKTRPDIRDPECQRITDIKTVVDARAFLRNDLIKFKYHVKASWYLDVCNGIDETADYFEFIWLVIEKTPPFGVMAYRMDITSDEFKEGRELGLKALAEYRDCLRADHWPCYDDRIRKAELPQWYKKRIG